MAAPWGKWRDSLESVHPDLDTCESTLMTHLNLKADLVERAGARYPEEGR